MNSLYPRDLRLLVRVARMHAPCRAARASGDPEDVARMATKRSRTAEGRPTLVVLCGPSHAGKSTFARAWRRRAIVLSSEEIRRWVTGRCAPSDGEARVWDAFERHKRRALVTGRDVVLDACHMSRRARWHALQGPNERYLKACVVFDVPLKTVLERCRRSGRVRPAEVRRMWRAFERQKPGYRTLTEEGFDFVAVVRR